MQHLSVDIETYSSVDLKSSGLYKYAQAADFQVLLFAYSVDGAPVEIIDLAMGEEIPAGVAAALFDSGVLKHAYNAAFEWYCLSRHFNLPDEARDRWLPQWRCTMLHGLYCGYTAGLDVTGEALGLPSDKRKLSTGRTLIKTFCSPKKNGTRVMPAHEPEKWNLFKTYCRQDVVAEMGIARKLSAFPVPGEEQRLWELDQIINARGINMDEALVNGALYCATVTGERLIAEAQRITGLENPRSVTQLRKWLDEELPEEEDLQDLQKKTVQQLLDRGVASSAAERMLEIRLRLGKTSTKKYDAMQACACADGRARGLLQHYGANRTGRWAGRLIQVQNLPKNRLSTLDIARHFAVQGKPDCLYLLYGNVPDTLSQLVRTAFIPSPGNVLAVADFSAIEARVIAWLAGEQWRMDVFRGHGKIYEASAASMFDVPIDRITKSSPLRQKGKVAELALGYQGSSGALIQMGALDMGLTEEELPEIVQRWRAANPRIVELWYAMETAAEDCVRTGRPADTHGIRFAREGDYAQGLDWLTVRLPSGRKLFYASPALGVNRWGNVSITYMGMDQKTRKWSAQETYGGKLTENVVQAIARDCLAEALQRLTEAGYAIVMHVHDEVVIDAPVGMDIDVICEIMCRPISWAPDLPLRTDGFISKYYKKD